VTKRSPTARPYADRVPRIPVGPLAPRVIDESRTWLTDRGYSPRSAAVIINLLKRLSLWMREVGAGVGDLDRRLLDRFEAAERAREVVCTTVTSSSGTMRAFLDDAGYLSGAGSPEDALSPAEAEIVQWCAWMRDLQGLAEKSINARCRYAAGLVEMITINEGAVQWAGLAAADVNDYVAETGRPYSAATRAGIVGAVRCLLRWALSTGRLDRDLSSGILTAAHKPRSVPRGVTAEHVAVLLSVCDPSTVLGARDRALVILLTRLGLRAGEASRLELGDIDWAHAQIRVTGKGREHVLPLPADVGDALAAWLRLRPEALDRAVFVRMRAPQTRMTVNGISGVIARLSDRAGIERIYAHRLRHTAAMNVLATGGCLGEAKELLGHAYTVTTMTYAKADLSALRDLVVPFGQVPR